MSAYLQLFDSATLITYLVAVTALVLAPGPGQALVVARSIEGGPYNGRLTALGLQISTMVHTAAATFGLSAILATSATAFSVIKYAGAMYLVALGLLALRHSSAPGAAQRRHLMWTERPVDDCCSMQPRFAAWRERVTGAVLIGLGMRLALPDRS